jgi:hypothetical protein
MLLEDNSASQRDFLTIGRVEESLNVMKSFMHYQSTFVVTIGSRQEMPRRYNMKWFTGDSSIQSFERFCNDELNYDTLLQRIRQTIQKHSQFYGQYRQVCMFDLASGLQK